MVSRCRNVECRRLVHGSPQQRRRPLRRPRRPTATLMTAMAWKLGAAFFPAKGAPSRTVRLGAAPLLPQRVSVKASQALVVVTTVAAKERRAPWHRLLTTIAFE